MGHFFVCKIERLDGLPEAWREESDDTGDAGRGIALVELGEEISDILGGSRERIARLRAEGLVPRKDEETSMTMQEMVEDVARDLARSNPSGGGTSSGW